MAVPELPQDFKEFLKLLNKHNVLYMVIGGYAVGFHGYPRATGDLDIWIKPDDENADKILVIENGKLIDSGTHQELISHKGLYKRLYNLQFREQNGDGS